MTDFWLASRTPRPTQPWGDDPPPAPEGASEREKGLVANAFEWWQHFTPFYLQTGDLVEVEINLKDAVWQASATLTPGRPESDAYWEALVKGIKLWRRDVWSAIGKWDEYGLDD